MASIPGTNIAAKIAPFDTADTYATHDEQYGQGGYRTVQNQTERNNITLARQKQGMLVYVIDDDVMYRLITAPAAPPLTNINWEAVGSGFVTLATVQEVSGFKDFSGGLSIDDRVPKVSDDIGSKIDVVDFVGPQIQTLTSTPSAAALVTTNDTYIVLSDDYIATSFSLEQGNDGFLYAPGTEIVDTSKDLILKIDAATLKVNQVTDLSPTFTGGFVDSPGCSCPRDNKYYFVYNDGVNGRIGSVSSDGVLSSTDVILNTSNQISIRETIYCPTSGYLFFVSRRTTPGGTNSAWLYVFDPATETVVNQQLLYWDSYGVTYSPRTDKIYVSGAGAGWFGGPIGPGLPNPSGNFSYIAVFSPLGDIEEVIVDNDRAYFYCQYCPVNDYIYVCNLNTGNIDLYNPVTYDKDDSINIGINPIYIRFNKDNGYLYVFGSGEIIILDPTSNTIIKRFDSDIALFDYTSAREAMLGFTTFGSETRIQIF